VLRTEIFLLYFNLKFLAGFELQTAQKMKKIQLNKKSLKQLNQLEMSAIRGGEQVVSSQATDMNISCCETKCGSALLPEGTEMVEQGSVIYFTLPNGYQTFTGGYTENGTYIPEWNGGIPTVG